MSEQRRDTPGANGTRAAAASLVRKPFVRPSVQDIGHLTLITLVTEIGGEG